MTIPPSGVWITGAGSGIGAALAHRWAGQGRRVIASGRRPDPLHQLAAQFPTLEALPLDVCDAAGVHAAVAALGERGGQREGEGEGVPGMAVLCAGTHQPTPATAFRAADVRQLVETNLMGIVHCLDALLPVYLARRSGTVVLVASVAGYRGLPTAGGYCASKAGVIALAEALKLDLDGTGVRVVLVNPGFVDTPLTRRNTFAMPDLITADQAARLIDAGLRGNRFEIAFPRRFATVMKLLRLLPDRLYFPLMHRSTGL